MFLLVLKPKALKNYAAAKVFPQNSYYVNCQPYFIDHCGVHCAVGYLIKVSGHEALAEYPATYFEGTIKLGITDLSGRLITEK